MQRELWSDRQILCVQPASGETMVSPVGMALVLSPCTTSLSHVKDCFCHSEAVLGLWGIDVTHNSQPASEPTLVKTLIYSRNSLNFWAGLSEEALGVCMPIEYHNQMMTTGDVSAGLTLVCVFSDTYCNGHSERRVLSDKSSCRTWICHNLHKLTSCRFKS